MDLIKVMNHNLNLYLKSLLLYQNYYIKMQNVRCFKFITISKNLKIDNCN